MCLMRRVRHKQAVTADFTTAGEAIEIIDEVVMQAERLPLQCRGLCKSILLCHCEWVLGGNVRQVNEARCLLQAALCRCVSIHSRCVIDVVSGGSSLRGSRWIPDGWVDYSSSRVGIVVSAIITKRPCKWRCWFNSLEGRGSIVCSFHSH
jgi:hypothetical protein